MMKNKKYRYYLIYQITNIVNDKIYIGMHCTDNIHDGYMGSGRRIKLAIKKYGKDKFLKSILFEFDNPEEMIRKEEEIVDNDFISRTDVYNATTGGIGYDRTGQHHTDHAKEKMKGRVPVIDSDGNRFKVSTTDPRYLSGELICVAKGRKYSQEFKDRMSAIAKSRSPMTDETKKKIGESVSGEKNGFYGKSHTEETKLKISKKNSEKFKGKIFSEDYKRKLGRAIIGHKWITSPDKKIRKHVHQNELDFYLDSGWVLGYKTHNPD